MTFRKTLLLATVAGALVGGVVAPSFASGWGMGRGDCDRTAALDANDDGKVEKSEFLAPMDQRFAALDADGDGRVTQSEFTAAGPMAAMPMKGAMMRQGKADPQDAKAWQARFDAMPESAKQMMQARADARFRGLDADSDGAVTKAEFDAMPSLMFAAADQNGDGVLSDGEGGRRGHHGWWMGDDDRKDD